MRDSFISYIRAGEKTEHSSSLGVEAEHFIVYKADRRAVPYAGDYGVRDILKDLAGSYEDYRLNFGEDLLGFDTADFSITIEPAAQLEIGTRQTDDIDTIAGIYGNFRKKLDDILKMHDMEVLSLGCQPVSRVDDLALIPKERYRIMDRHFASIGDGGRQMMRGTASTQVSIDFYCEEDFRKKVQAAYFFTPLFYLISDRCREFEGKKLDSHIKRADIWNRTDPDRCGIIPGVFKRDFGYGDCADFYLNMPLVVLPEGDRLIYTKETAKALFDAGRISAPDIPHIISMAFTDVRPKQYVEIRAADCMTPEGIYAYCALIKGLIYSNEVLEGVQEELVKKNIREEDFRASLESLKESGFEGKIYGEDARAFAQRALSAARNNLSEHDNDYLDGFDFLG